MPSGLTREELIAFEEDIAREYEAGHIHAPIHLSKGNEDALIRIFKNIRPQDWIAVQWRSHLHCLLHGVPPAKLKAAIMAGRSITLNFPEHRIFSSAIAGGHLPIAVGIAAQIKRDGGQERVWAFCGDMTARMGIYHECLHYATGHALPIMFVKENNHLSVCSDTSATWGDIHWDTDDYTRSYSFTAGYPHSGVGRRINF